MIRDDDAQRKPSVKGALLLHRLEFVTEQRGAQGLERVLARMLAGDRKVLSGAVMPFAWFDLGLCARLDFAIAEEFAAGRELFLLLGARAAEAELPMSAWKRFLEAKSPHALLKQTAAVRGAHYEPTTLRYEKSGETSAFLVETAEGASSTDCWYFVGWLRKAIALVGGTRVEVFHPKCRAEGDASCEYTCDWSKYI